MTSTKSLKILSIKKTSEFAQVNKLGNKFFLDNFVIIKSPTPPKYYKQDCLEGFSELKNTAQDLSVLDFNKTNQSSKKAPSFLKKTKVNLAINFCRVGYTVSKSVSKFSYQRNFVKRRLREAFKANNLYLQNHCDYVIIARKNIVNSDYKKILNDLKFALKKLNHTK